MAERGNQAPIARLVAKPPDPSMSTAGWANGVYMITASYGDKVSCGASTNPPCLAVTAPGQFAFDGAVPARHTVQDMGQTSFGVVVAPAPNSKNTYQDELNVVTASYPERKSVVQEKRVGIR